MYGVSDLASNIWTNKDEIPDNGIDDDDNGYIDDYHGINVMTISGDAMDDNFHGTHLSGKLPAFSQRARKHCFTSRCSNTSTDALDRESKSRVSLW